MELMNELLAIYELTENFGAQSRVVDEIEKINDEYYHVKDLITAIISKTNSKPPSIRDQIHDQQ